MESDVERSNEWLRLFGQAVELGRLRGLRRFRVVGSAHYGGMQTAATVAPDLLLGEGKGVFFTALGLPPGGTGQVPLLSELTLRTIGLTDEQGVLLAEAVRVGNFRQVRVLELRSNWNLGRLGMEALVGAVEESEEGMPFLETLDVAYTHAGMGGASLGPALLSGKLGKLCKVNFMSSHLTADSVRALAGTVREGRFSVVSFLDLSHNELDSEAVGEFMTAIVQSEAGLPFLKVLDLRMNHLQSADGALVRALASGKLPTLEGLHPFHFSVGREGVEALAHTVREGREFPARLHQKIEFRLHDLPDNQTVVDPLLIALAESQKGLPRSISSLELNFGILREEAMALLASNQGEGGSCRGWRY
uniref:Uncharacterized protein n=1 Tax=Chromera velia CCMP2878 TaxID=1169474 RepID=A0A0G4GSK5_9ALVE|eukprot:Cvel_23211.t1-p1 / transcript=Cvel_23211.t1 / gene=Cvel_23211 / organism=Chromera_velia_CCMP2878 / gene_product=hypothetical protein / transcript_product=hypothetical protein / location=Cvel_scaffold2366:18996-20078(+) / protein_length=361 / sequence_SO=supercontig / SO=protein_coding / is_pseudo=false